MNNPVRSLSDDNLHKSALIFAAKERETTHQVLLHINEINQRRLYAKLGYGSLFEYCTRELKYSESSAYRRIQAARLISDVPEVMEQVKIGEVNLSNLSQVQTFVRNEEKRTGEKLSIEMKQRLIEKIENQSLENARRILVEALPQAGVVREKERILPEGKTAVTIVLPPELQQKLEKVKQLSSHKNDNPSWAQLLETLADEYLKNKDPEAKPATQSFAARKSNLAPESKSKQTRQPIRVTIRRAIYKRAKSTCEYIHPETRRRCNNRYHLQMDHIKPISKGGKSDFDNLQLLCR